MSQTEDLMRDLRKLPLFQSLIPMEAGIGWPIPIRIKSEGKMLIRLLLFGQGTSEKQDWVNLFPPLATMTLNWTTVELVEVILFPPLAKTQIPENVSPSVEIKHSNPAPQLLWTGVIGIFPHAAVEPLGRKGYLQKRHSLLKHYDDLFHTLYKGRTRSHQEDAAFGQLLGTLIEPGLVPYYQAIAPKFVTHFLSQFKENYSPIN